ncbi:MAG: glycoside hydrolase 43 family protein [Bacteroidales bacterium]|nr:glycoside hydrolase 43 family protein [Bacteroidales bacterium]
MKKIFAWALAIAATCSIQAQNISWTADNGNGTYTNPLFYDEFSDPDVIRVGEDYYLAGTTMHCVPGLVVLHSKDLVNWELASYCFDRWEDIFPGQEKFTLNDGKNIYGQGVWAPVIRYNDGKFYVFTNVNGNGLQLFISESANGPWEHRALGGHIYDLSVLFDDDGTVWAIHGYDEVKVTQFKPDFRGYVEGSERVIIPRGSAMGEGHHAYKIDGQYYILSAEYSPMGRLQCARSKSLFGPYETAAISCDESLGTKKFPLVDGIGRGNSWMSDGAKFRIGRTPDNELGNATVHQGGMVQTPGGSWWGCTMLDFVGVGRTTCLCPITWTDGWPMFGLEGNPGRTPRTWTIPDGKPSAPKAPYQRNDDFNGKQLQRVWQWNHEPVAGKWSLTKGKLRLQALSAENMLWAHNTLTQRCIGPVSTATVTLDGSHLKDGDCAGLGMLNLPYAWVGLTRDGGQLQLQWHHQQKEAVTAATLDKKQTAVQLRIYADLDEMWATFSYSTDGGTEFNAIGDTLPLPYQLRIFQGSRYSLFCFHKTDAGNDTKKAFGYADFDNFTVDEPLADRTANFPVGKVITLTNLADGSRLTALRRGLCHRAYPNSREWNGDDCKFRVHDRGQGRVVLEAMNGMGFVTVTGMGLSADVRLVKDADDASLIQWQDMLRGQCMLLSLKTNRYIGCSPTMGEPYSARFAGSDPNRRNGCVFKFDVVE